MNKNIDSSYIESVVDDLVIKCGFLLENQVIVDVGSNVGIFSKKIVNYIKNYKSIHLFEPCKKYLEISKEELGFLQNIYFYNYALGSKREDKKIYKSISNIGHNTLLTKDPVLNANFYQYMDQEDVKVIRLDDCFDKRDGLDFLKIDVEGYEAEVIEGALNLIEEFQPYILVEVSWGTNHPNWQKK